MKFNLEDKLKWIEFIFPFLMSQYPKSTRRLYNVIAVLQHGREKHHSSYTSIREHLEHAMNHLDQYQVEEKESESNISHMAHVAARCLLVFGQIMNLTWEIKK